MKPRSTPPRATPESSDGFPFQQKEVHPVRLFLLKRNLEYKIPIQKFDVSATLIPDGQPSHQGSKRQYYCHFLSSRDVVVSHNIKLTIGIMYTSVIDTRGACN